MNVTTKIGLIERVSVMLTLFVCVSSLIAAESEVYKVPPLSIKTIEHLLENTERLSKIVYDMVGREFMFVEAMMSSLGSEEVIIPVIQIVVAQQKGLTCGPCAMIIAGSIIATELQAHVTKNEYQLDRERLCDGHYFDVLIDAMKKKGIKTQDSEMAELFLWWNFNDGAPVLDNAMKPPVTTIDSDGELMRASHCPQKKESLKDDIIPLLWEQLDSEKPYAMVFLINTGENGKGSHWFPLVVIQYEGGARSYFVADSFGNIKRLEKDCPIGRGKTVTLLHIIKNIEESIILFYKKQEQNQ